MLIPYVDHFQDPGQIIAYRIQSEESGLTITQVLRARLKISRGLLRKLRGDYRLRYNGSFVFFDTRVETGDLLEFNFNFDEEADFPAIPQKLAIIFEDENLLIVNKPAGILVHPTADERTATLANGVLYYLRSQGNTNLFRAIHRLDRNTSGLLLIAKNQYAHNYMTDQFDRQKIHREYLAFVQGLISFANGTIDAPIGRAEGSIIQRQIDEEDGKDAVTHYQVLERYPQSNVTMVALRLETGRTHQIRIHLSHLGYPLLGDTLYTGDAALIGRHALHSWRIRCQMPFSHEEREFEAPLAPDLQRLVQRLK